MSETTHDEIVKELAEWMEEAGAMERMTDGGAEQICRAHAEVAARYFGEQIDAVDVVGARVAVERMSAYGLEIEVDANGRASTVRFPDGAVLC